MVNARIKALSQIMYFLRLIKVNIENRDNRIRQELFWMLLLNNITSIV